MRKEWSYGAQKNARHQDDDENPNTVGAFVAFTGNKKPSRWVPGGLPIGSAGYARTTLAA